MLILLVVAAFATLFLPMPRWLSIVLDVLFLGAGLMMVLFGGLGDHADQQLRPGGDNPARAWLIAGALLLLSRIRLVVRVVMEALVAP